MIKGGRTNQFSKHKRIMALANVCRLATELECNVGAATTKDFDSQQDLYDEKKTFVPALALEAPRSRRILNRSASLLLASTFAILGLELQKYPGPYCR